MFNTCWPQSAKTLFITAVLLPASLLFNRSNKYFPDLYQTLQLVLQYSTLIWCTWLMSAGSNFAFKIVFTNGSILYELDIALSNGTIADPLRITV